jgi:tetratricopeptide (TPR) repeat protein
MDSLFNSPGYTSGRIEDIIYKEEILPRLWKCDGDCKPITNKPNWNNFQKILFLKYPKAPIAKILQTSKIKWYEYLKDTIALIRENVSKIETFGLDTVGFAKPELNNMVYNLVFKGSNDPIVLKKAISWMEVLVKIEPNAYYFIDTYANLLYKAGRVKEALDWETKATNIAPDNEEIAENLLKMKGRKQTWPGGK